MIRLITFDLDATLWDGVEVVHRAESEMVNWVAKRVGAFPEIYRSRATDVRGRILANRPRLHYNFNKIRAAIVEQILLECGLPAHDACEVANAALCVFHGSRNQLPLKEDAVNLLRELHQRFRLASISNGTTEVHRTPLKEFFEMSVYARNMGTRKPDPAMFEMVLAHTKTLPKEAIHVGDHPIEDIRCANKMGMHTIQCLTESHTSSPLADQVVDRLADVLEAVNVIETQVV